MATQGAASLTQGADVLSADGTRGVAFAPWAQHTFPITADDLSRTARRDTTYAPSLDFSDVRNSMYIGLTL